VVLVGVLEVAVESTFETPMGHPVLACVESVTASVKAVTDVSPVFMDTADKRAALLGLARVEAQLIGLRMRVLAVADDVAQAEGARDVAALLTHHTRGDAVACRRELRLAEALDRRWTQLADALGAGEVNLPQAVAIAHALDELPADELEADVLSRAEAHLVAEASHHGPRELRVLGRRILEVVAPGLCQEQEGRALEAEERKARETTSLTMTRLGDGSTRIMIKVPDAVAGRLRTYLEAFTSPRHQAKHGLGEGEGDRIPGHRKLGQAFGSFLEAADPKQMPVHGGDATTLIVTVSLEDLRHDLGLGETAAGDRLSAAEVRRLACTAHIVPAVLGAKSEVLDLGRSSRIFRPAQRKAMVVRDRKCREESCTIPATWCEAHHWGTPWSRGGRTDLADGVLLCPWHHHRAHDPTYDASRLPNGDVRFTRRTREGSAERWTSVPRTQHPRELIWARGRRTPFAPDPA